MGRPDKKAALTLVMITGDESEHRYVANRILEEFDLEAIIVDRGRRHTRSDRLRYLLEKYTARQFLSRLLLRLTSVILRDKARRRHDLQDVLGPRATTFAQPDLVRHVDGINAEAGRAAVSDTSPDLLLIYGTGIVGGRVLDLASQGAINLHTGMSPEYRGTDSSFWPIYNKEFHLVGATVHECTAHIDGGAIYERAPAHLQDRESQFTVFARCVELGAELYVATIYRAHEGRLEGEHQDLTIGREYHAEDKRLRHDLFARWLLRSRKARKPIENVAIRQRDQ